MVAKKVKDRVWIGPKDDTGQHRAVRDRGDGNLEPAHFRPAKNGEAIPPGSELVFLDPKQGDDGGYDVAASYKSGPAQVATRAYRDGYDRIFGKQKTGLA